MRPVLVAADVADLIEFAARASGVSVSGIVANAVRALFGGVAPRDPWTPVPLYGEYEGHAVTATYVPATHRVVVTSPPLNGCGYRSPSAAATAVVAALNPGRPSPQTNGWRFWRLTESGARLDTTRR